MSKKGNSSDKFGSAVVPQTDSLERVIQVVEIVARTGGISDEQIGLSPRHVNYVRHAARLLGLLTADDGLTSVGRKLVTLQPNKRTTLLAAQFEESECGRAWLSWAQVTSLEHLDPESAFSFLGERSVLPASMVQRRGRTLRRWCRDLSIDTVSEVAKKRNSKGDRSRGQMPRGR